MANPTRKKAPPLLAPQTETPQTDDTSRGRALHIEVQNYLALAWSRLVEGDLCEELTRVCMEENCNAVFVRALDFARVDGMVFNRRHDYVDQWDSLARYQWGRRQRSGVTIDIKSGAKSWKHQWKTKSDAPEVDIFFFQPPHTPTYLYALPYWVVQDKGYPANISVPKSDAMLPCWLPYCWPNRTWPTLLDSLLADTTMLSNPWNGVDIPWLARGRNGSDLHVFGLKAHEDAANSMSRFAVETHDVRSYLDFKARLNLTPFQPWGGDLILRCDGPNDGDALLGVVLQLKSTAHKSAILQAVTCTERFDYLAWEDQHWKIFSRGDLQSQSLQEFESVKTNRSRSEWLDKQVRVCFKAHEDNGQLILHHLIENSKSARLGLGSETVLRNSQRAELPADYKEELDRLLREEEDEKRNEKQNKKQKQDPDQKQDEGNSDDEKDKKWIEVKCREWNNLSAQIAATSTSKRTFMMPLQASLGNAFPHPYADVAIFQVPASWDVSDVSLRLCAEEEDLRGRKCVLMRLAPVHDGDRDKLSGDAFPLNVVNYRVPLTQQKLFFLGFLQTTKEQYMLLPSEAIQWPQEASDGQMAAEPPTPETQLTYATKTVGKNVAVSTAWPYNEYWNPLLDIQGYIIDVLCGRSTKLTNDWINKGRKGKVWDDYVVTLKQVLQASISLRHHFLADKNAAGEGTEVNEA